MMMFSNFFLAIILNLVFEKKKVFEKDAYQCVYMLF